MLHLIFQKFDIWPVLVRVDYSPCRVDLAALRAGKYVELVNLVPWKVSSSFLVSTSNTHAFIRRDLVVAVALSSKGHSFNGNLQLPLLNLCL